MAESSSVTEPTDALTLQGSCQAADSSEYIYGVTSPDKMADGEFLQGATKETRNGDVHKHEVVGGFESDFDQNPGGRFPPNDDQKVPTAFCAEDTFPGDVPSYPVTREPEIPLGSDAASFPQQYGTSDSGFEENKTPRAASATSPRKKYGIDAKNDSYKPGGGNVKITDQKVTVRHVGSKIDARSKTPTSTQRDSTPRTPKGPTPDTKNVQSKIGSLKNATHTPGGGNVKIANQKKDYSAVQGKIGSKVNLDHRPKGGDKKILSKKLEWKAESRVGSLDNAKHAPGGGKVKITNEKVAWKTESRVGSLDNVKHEAGGGNVKIETAKLDFKEKAASKVGSKDNMDHKAGGGDKKIETKKLDFKEKAASKIGSKDNATHKPGGGEKKVLQD